MKGFWKRMTDIVARTLEFLSLRSRAYKVAFGSTAGKEVLKDLTVYCKVLDTSFDPDPVVMARFEGRRDVVLRIQKHCKLTPDELFDIYNNKGILKGDTK